MIKNQMLNTSAQPALNTLTNIFGTYAKEDKKPELPVFHRKVNHFHS